MNLGFSESVRQTRDSLNVDFARGYMRKYWSLKKETLTCRCLSTEARETDLQKLRNEIRAFLYVTPGELIDLINEVETEYYTLQHQLIEKLANEEELTQEEQKNLKLDYQLSVKVRAYEKEFFYLKCLALNQVHAPARTVKPQLVLRALAKLSMERSLETVFTSPESIFSLLYFQECKEPLWEKDIFPKKSRKNNSRK